MGEGRKDAEQRLRDQQKALAEFGLFAFRSNDVDAMLQRATELVSQGLDVRLAKVVRLIEGSDRLLICAGVNWKPGVVGRATLAGGRGSPAGYALLTGEPVVSGGVAGETRFEIPDILREHGIRSMVNVPIVGERCPFGVLEVDEPRERDFDEDDIAFLWTYANLLAAAVDRIRKHEELEVAVREHKMLVQELQHRVKNMLGLVLALAQQTRAEDEGARSYREKLVGRLQALSRAENLVFEDDEHAREMDMHRLVEAAIHPFSADAALFEIDGPPVRLPARSGRLLGLALHELCTNAAKHGALTRPEGSIRVRWATQEDEAGPRLSFCWAEAGGPPVSPPSRNGFGTTLLTQVASYELDGVATLEHPSDGLRYALDFPMRAE